MPRVPTYDTFQAAPSVRPQVALQSPDAPDVAGTQLRQAGQDMSRSGETFGRIAADIAEQANQLRVDDAINKTKEAAMRLTYGNPERDPNAGLSGFGNLKGEEALNRPDGRPLSEEYAGHLQDQVAQIADGLGNDAQKRAYSMRANDILTSFKGQAIGHEAQQQGVYQLSVREGTIRTRMDEVGLNYNNPAVIDNAVSSIKAAAYDAARMQGKSAVWAEAEALKYVSNAHKIALVTALDKNELGYAEAYLKHYGNDIEAEDKLRVLGLITKQKDQIYAVNTATQVMQEAAPRLVTSNTDRAFNIATQNNPDPAHIQFDKQGFQELIQHYNGDMSKVYAATQGGADAVHEAEQEAAKQGGTWLAYLPQDTQDYVAKGLNAYAAGDGENTKPTLQEIHQSVRAKLGTTSPTRLRLGIEEATRQYEDAQKATKEADDAGVANAMRTLQQNGGRFSDLPLATRAQIPPKEVDNVMNYAARVAKGDDVTNPAVYQKLASQPGYLRSLSDDEFFRLKPDLNETDFKHFANERAATTQKGPPEQNLNRPAINTVLNERLRMVGIDPTPKDDGTADAARVGAIRSYIDKSILNAQSAAGKKLTDSEVEKHIDGVFAKEATFRNTFLGFTTGTAPKRAITVRPNEVPSDIRDRLIADFKTHGVANPSDAEILGAYWQLTMGKQ